MSDAIESQIGRVTARVAPNTLGEVRLPYKGGTETFHALAWDDGQVIDVGTEIVVIELVGPRTVKVTPFSAEPFEEEHTS
jgi:hypothetical protein